MSAVSNARLFAAIDATWPPAEIQRQRPWVLRVGNGGGKRVSATGLSGAFSQSQIDCAEENMARLGQPLLFMIQPHQRDLDEGLQARGYDIVDPVSVLACPVERLTDRPIPDVTTFPIWEPLAIMREIWAKGGIGRERIAVMSRAKVKTAILARWNHKPAGVGFVAVDDEIAMVHAVEVVPQQRRQGVAQWIMRQAAFWAKETGAKHVSVLCTKANEPALRLYKRLGFAPVTSYHYRLKTTS